MRDPGHPSVSHINQLWGLTLGIPALNFFFIVQSLEQNTAKFLLIHKTRHLHHMDISGASSRLDRNPIQQFGNLVLEAWNQV